LYCKKQKLEGTRSLCVAAHTASLAGVVLEVRALRTAAY